MPLYANGAQLVRRTLEEIGKGNRVRVVAIGELTAVQLSVNVMQADRVLFATHYVVNIDSHSAARAREKLPEVGETGVSPLLVASEATVTGHVPDGILGKQLG